VRLTTDTAGNLDAVLDRLAGKCARTTKVG